MTQALFEIVRHTNNDSPLTVAVVFDTEQKVKLAVNRLNHKIGASWLDSYIDIRGKRHYYTEDELNEVYEFGGDGPYTDFYTYVPVTPVSAMGVVNALHANSLKKREEKSNDY